MLSIGIPWNSDFPLGIRRNPQELMEESKDLKELSTRLSELVRLCTINQL